MRLIDADKLKKELSVSQITSLGFRVAVNVIDRSKTVDAVKVVRCKDCKYRGKSSFSSDKIYCQGLRAYMDETDFCSYGECKEG